MPASLPSRERGLKFAPANAQIPNIIKSLPSRERGLKYATLYGLAPAGESLPSRERGLKLRSIGKAPEQIVAPFTGAWIEMFTG